MVDEGAIALDGPRDSAAAAPPRYAPPPEASRARGGAATAAATAGAAAAAGWEWPRASDPRLPFAAILTAYAVLGFTLLGFNRTYAQMAIIVGAGSALDMALAWLLRGRRLVPLSAYISCVSLALLLNYGHGSWVLLLPVYLAIGSKYVLTCEGRHIYNPSMFGVAVSLLVSGELITTAPAYQWAGGAWTMSAFLLMAALVMFISRIGRGWLVGSFILFYALQTGLRAWIMRHHLPWETLFLGTLGSPPFFLFTFYMLTDPQTSPKTPRGQVAFAFALTLVDLWLHTKESVYTIFYAALAMGTGKLVVLHARSLWKAGPAAYVRGLFAPRVLSAAAVVVALGAGLGGAYAATAGARRIDPGFRFERLAPERTGIYTEMGTLLTDVDPRLHHIAKWVLSVGDAVAVGDVDGDGRLDLFLTNILKRPEDRAALYRNLGDFRFERVPIPALDIYREGFRDLGLPAGATLVDYDGDGDLDLALAVGYGPSRLLRNTLRERGALGFEDVTAAMGIDEHTVSLAWSFFDFDRDARLDMLVANAMTARLYAYGAEGGDGADAPPLNIFRLPEPAYEGDRRMFAFMHDGWHDADNGSLNALFRGRKEGGFERLDAAAMGMPETHWSLAIGTLDANRDGFTDLYICTDFGPDDLYLNARGERFERVSGRWFGDIGRDTYKGMNVSVADFDRNGWLDVHVSNVHHALQAEGSLLWMMGPGEDGGFVPRIVDEAAQRGALNERRFGWGAAAGDLDADGWPDMVQANGMVDDRLDRLYGADEPPSPLGALSRRGGKDYWYVNHKLMQSGPDIHTYADQWGDLRGRTIYPNEARRAYMNLGGRGTAAFADAAEALGIADPDNSRGVALADLDDDGDLDCVITNQHGPVSIYRSNLREAGRPAPADAGFVGLRLVGDGVRTHRSAIGTRVTIRYPAPGDAGGGAEGVVEQVREVGTLTGFAAQGDPRLHFGLGAYRGPVEVDIDWYGADRERVTLEAERYHEVQQRSSVRAP